MDEFHHSKAYSDGYISQCKKCISIIKKEKYKYIPKEQWKRKSKKSSEEILESRRRSGRKYYINKKVC